MANWCNNTIIFQGSPEQIECIAAEFLRMEQLQTATGEGQLPPYCKDETGYVFDIQWMDDAINYQTRWSPNREVMVRIADHYQVGFSYSYEEMGNCIYGEAHYQSGVLEDTGLEYAEFMQYQYDEQADHYIFEGETFENDLEILETLLERKKQAQQEVYKIN